MFRRALFTVALVATPLMAGPGKEASGKACISIENDLDRLACYDRALGRTPVEEKAALEGDVGAWDVSVETSEMDDSTSVYLSLRSLEPVACSAYGDRQKLTLLIRCVENTTAMYFTGNSCHFADGFDGYGRADLRVDDHSAYEVRMFDSTDSKALGFWRGRKAIPQIKRLLGGETLLLRTTPFGMSPFTAKFPIAGIDEAIKPLRAACHW